MEVEDHGPGIAAADLPYIFDRYYRSRSDAGKPVSYTHLVVGKLGHIEQVVGDAAHDGAYLGVVVVGVVQLEQVVKGIAAQDVYKRQACGRAFLYACVFYSVSSPGSWFHRR